MLSLLVGFLINLAVNVCAIPTTGRAGEVTRGAASLVDVALAPSAESASVASRSEMGIGEANRLWQQFGVLDERFSEAARVYMNMALVSSQKATRSLIRRENGSAVEQAVRVDATDGRAHGQAFDPAKYDVEMPAAKDAPEKIEYGFYLHVFFEAAAVVKQLRDVRKFYPEAPVYIMSDGGANYSGICQEIGNCRSAWRSPAHDCWNPKPFLNRIREGAEWLLKRKAEWTILLEPDVTLHKRASFPVQGDAGGLRDMWNAPLPTTLRAHMVMLGRNFSGNKNFSLKWDRFGFCGGSIIRTKAAVISFKPDNINWPEMEVVAGGAREQIYSSDIAMLIALGSHGFNYYPWEDLREGNDEYQPKHDVAFEHFSKNTPGGKPLYGVSLAKEDEKLVGPPPPNTRPIKIGQCQHCVWVEENGCWPQEENGFIECPTDQELFKQKAYPLEPPNPGLFHPVTGALI